MTVIPIWMCLLIAAIIGLLILWWAVRSTDRDMKKRIAEGEFEPVSLQQKIAQVQWQREHEAETDIDKVFETGCLPPVKVREHKLDFDALSAQIVSLKPKAQATFLFKLITAMEPDMVDTARKYANMKLKGYGKDSKLRPRKYNPHTDEFEPAV
jgi:hypothetical protein